MTGKRPPPPVTGNILPDEAFEPYEEFRTIPIPILSVAVALVLWGGLTLYQNSQAVGIGQQERAEDLSAQPARGTDSGAALFGARCATCHQANGVGVRNAIPPLAASEFVASAPQTVTQILLHGIDGPIRVSGQLFDGHMPSFASVLPDVEIASIVNYVRQRFGAATESSSIDSAFVAEQRARFGNRGSWFGGEEIAAVLDSTLPVQPTLRQAWQGSDDPGLLELVNDGRGVVWACSSCHGVDGQGGETIPRLAGLPSGYVVKQLEDYVSGARQNESMALVASALTSEEMTKLGDYYASLRAPSNAAPALGGDLKRGEQLALEGDWSLDVPSCFSCHGPSGIGVAPGFPPLAAQHPAYTAAQLAAWVGGQRDNAPVALMNHIASALDDDDRRAVADYLATLPPVSATGQPPEVN